MTATTTGKKVLAGFAKGRAIAIKQAKIQGEASTRMVQDLLAADLHAGRPERGRATRIARLLRGRLSYSQVTRILHVVECAILDVSDSLKHTGDDNG